jgi:hypothetical protein
MPIFDLLKDQYKTQSTECKKKEEIRRLLEILFIHNAREKYRRTQERLAKKLKEKEPEITEKSGSGNYDSTKQGKIKHIN